MKMQTGQNRKEGIKTAQVKIKLNKSARVCGCGLVVAEDKEMLIFVVIYRLVKD